jgi:predicted  nucleic acid-binding Zn-ribbon protein
MARPALKLELEAPLEERAARLEANVEHIQKDVSDMKIDIRRLNDKIDGVDQKLSTKIDNADQKLSAKIDGVDQRLSAKIDGVDQRLSAKIDGVDQKLSVRIDSVKDLVTALAVNMEKAFANVEKRFTDIEKSFAVLHSARAFDRVWWLLMSAGLLGVMARAFKWI